MFLWWLFWPVNAVNGLVSFPSGQPFLDHGAPLPRPLVTCGDEEISLRLT